MRSKPGLKGEHVGRRTMTVMFVAAALAAPAATAAANGDGDLPRADAAFLDMAAQGDQFEVSSGRLAEQRGTSEAVKALGRLLQRDHGRHYRQTRALAARFDERVPSMPGPVQQWIADELAMAPAQEFDRRFLLLGIADHKEDIGHYRLAARTADTAAVRDFARRTIPVLRTHLQRFRAAFRDL
jgi:putative membrane protein